MRGPIGGWFVWDGATPALLVGRRVRRRPVHRDAAARQGDSGREDLLRIAVSSRTLAELPYADELMAPAR